MNANVDLTGVVLETDRLIIREWSEMDLEDFFEYAKVDGVGQMAGWNPHTSIQESKTILEMFINEKMTFALELKENHKVIGSLGLETLSLLLRDEYENLVGRELGYVLSKEYWGKGLMPEAVNRVIKFCFEQENYDYLMCSHFVINSQSKRAAWRRFSFPARRAKTQPVLHIKIQFFLRAKRREVCRFVMEWQKKKICFGLMFFERKIIFILFPYMLLIWLTVKNLLMLRSHMSM